MKVYCSHPPTLHQPLQAQCCELERLRLVDGTVTDDSDAFAFGGKSVYKNIFNEKKYVEAYLLADAEKVHATNKCFRGAGKKNPPFYSWTNNSIYLFSFL